MFLNNDGAQRGYYPRCAPSFCNFVKIFVAMKQYSILFFFLFCTCLSFSQTPSLNFLLKSEFAVTFPGTPQAVVPDAQEKPYFYLAAKAGGLQVYNIENESIPVLVKTISIAQLGNLEVMNATQRGTYFTLRWAIFLAHKTFRLPALPL